MLKWWSAAIGALFGIAIFYIGIAQGQILRFSGGPSLASGSIPAGVSLQAIQGGATYYGSNGFTKATSPIIFGGVSYPQGWDSPGFISFGPWLTPFNTQQDANRWVSIGLNTAFLFSAPHSGQLDLFHSNSISVIVGYQALGSIIFNDRQPGNESVGILTWDEPPTTVEMLQAPVAGTTTASFTGVLDSSCTGGNACLTVTGFTTGLGPLFEADVASYNVPSLPYITGAGVPAFAQINARGSGVNGNGQYGLCNSSATGPTAFSCLSTGFSAVGPEVMTQSAVSGLSSTLINNRFLWSNFAGPTVLNSLLVASPGGNTPVTTALGLTYPTADGSSKRHLDLTGTDFYFFVSARGGNNGQITNIYDTTNGSPPLTQAQAAKGSHYGDTADFIRAQQTTYAIPQLMFIENGNGITAIPYVIQPLEINWAVWSSLIHGAMVIAYFNEEDGVSPSKCIIGDNFACAYMQAAQGAQCLSCTYYPLQNALSVSSTVGVGLLFPGMQTSAGQSTILQQTAGVPASPGGQGTYAVTASPTGHPLSFVQPASMTTAVASTNSLVTTMAPVLKGNYAFGFVTSVNPSGYSFDPVITKTGVGQNFASATSTGIETMVKYYTGSQYTASDGTVITPNTFYIFADTRNPETDTNISATFTVKAGSSVTVINESRSITITGGQFTDTFANAWTVHIYKVNP